MSLGRAAALLWSASVRNRVVRQLHRLKQPRYLIATLVGAFYFWSVFLRRLDLGYSGPGLDPRTASLIEALLIGMGLFFVAGAWLFGAERAQLEFSEAEIQFLFPAPVTRRALLWFKIARSLLRMALSAAFSAIFVGGAFNQNRAFFAVGAWFCYSTLALHLTGASLTRESLARHGRFGVVRRPLTLAVIALVLGVVAWSVLTARPPPATVLDLEGVSRWLDELTHQPPLGWVLLPFRAPLRVALAADPAAFLGALPAAGVVLAAHALWVVSTNVAFEEASVEAAEARARRLEQRREGKPAIGAAARRFSPRLSPRGRPELALIWKNVIAARRTLGPLVLAITTIFGLGALVSGFQLLRGTPSGIAALLALACAAMAAFLTVLGPAMLRVDLRQDLPQMDILRTLPLTGTQVVRAELLAPGLLLALAQWILLALAVVLSVRYPIPGFGVGERVAAAVALGFVAPAFSLAGLAVQNAAVLLFPAWTVVDRAQPRGFEAIGQRLLTTAGSLLVLGLGMAPAVLAGGLVMLVAWSWLGLYAAPLAGAMAAAVIGAELFVLTIGMGRLYARFDVSE